MQDLNYQVIIPDLDQQLEQDDEWVIVNFGDRQEKVRLHDYDAIYKIPGLYEEIFYNRLQCNSPEEMCDMLSDTLENSGCSVGDLRVLDFGAGNGIVGEQIRERGCELIVGIDILTEAKEAAYRDRAGIYDDYHVTDLSQLDGRGIEELKQYGFNALITVAALGFNDIPPGAFLNAFNLIKDGGWIAFNIKDRFLTNEDNTGYKDAIKGISGDNFSVYQRKRYRHRFSLGGEELNYVAIVGKKIRDVNLMEIL